EITQRPQSGFRFRCPPCPGQVRVCLIIFVDKSAEVDRTANCAVLDQLPGMLECGISDVIIADYRLPSRTLGCGSPCLGVLQRECHRLFTMDVLACFKSRDGNLGMQLVWCRDADNVDSGISDDISPIIRHAGKAELVGY